SHESFQKDCMNLTESTAPLVLITTFLPVLSVSAPPKAQSIVYVKVGASPKVWPSVCPYGLPFFFRAGKSLAAASQVLGYSLAPASFSQDFRYATAFPKIEWGSPSHLPLTSQEGGKIS